MSFSLASALASPAVGSVTSAADLHGRHALTFTLTNKSAAGDFLYDAVKNYAVANGTALKESVYNTHLNFYLVPALEVGVGALTKTTAKASTKAVNLRVPVTELVAGAVGSAAYKPFIIEGLPAGSQYKYGFELVINGAAQADWISSSDAVSTTGSSVVAPTATVTVTEDGDNLKVVVDSVAASGATKFLLEVVDSVKAAMPELPYSAKVVLVAPFTFDAANKPTFSFSSLTAGMFRYVGYKISIRAVSEASGSAASASEATLVTPSPVTLPWLGSFVDQTVIKGKQIEDSLMLDVAYKIVDSGLARDALRAALNTGSYSTAATVLFGLVRDVAVDEFRTIAAKFDAVRQQLRRIALYSAYDATYSEILDLTDTQTREAFDFVTKQGYSGTVATNYYSWQDKAYTLAPVVESGSTVPNKYRASVLGAVYRDRAEITFI